MDEVVGPGIRRIRAAVSRREVFEKFDAGSRRGAQCGDPQTRPEYVVQTFLLGTVVLTLAGNLKAKHIAIEPQAGLCVGNNDRGVIYSQKEPALGALPLRIPLAGGEREDLEGMAVRIAEIKGFDAGGIPVPFGQTLRTGGRMLHLRSEERRVGKEGRSRWSQCQ